MSADLKASDFEERQARSVIQAVTDTVAGLELLTRGEWKQQLGLDRERHQALLDKISASEKMLLDKLADSEKMLLDKLADSEKMLLDKLAASEKLNQERHRMLLDRLAASEKMLLDKLAASEKLNQERHRMLLDRLSASEKMLLDRLAASEKMLLGQIAEFKETNRSLFLWMRWGFGIFATLMLFLVTYAL